GWYDHGCLSASTCHVIGLSWDGILAEAIDPKKSAVDWEFVGHPSRCWCADEFHVTLGQNAFAVPDAILEIKVAQPRPVATAANLVALSQKISEWISFNLHCAAAKLVKKHPLRERKIPFTTLLDCELDQIADQHWISVTVTSNCVGRPLLRTCGSIMVKIDSSRIKIQMVRIRTRRIIIGVLGRSNPKSARHMEKVLNA